MVLKENLANSKIKKNLALFSGTRVRNMGVFFALIALTVFFASLSHGRFFTISNFLTVSRQVSLVMIVGVGAELVMITGNIDLAVGSYLALSGVLVAAMLRYGISWYLALIIVIIFMGLIGTLVGIAVAKQKLNSLIVTLAMLSIAKGAALAYTGGIPIFIKNETFISIGNGYFGPIPIPVVIAFFLLIIGQFVLQKTKFGRYIYAVGGNMKAAIASGINVDRIIIYTFAITGMLCGISGSILAGRLFSGNPTVGQDFNLDVIASIVIGGTSLLGGIGNMWGLLIGAFLVGIIGNGLTILGVSTFYQIIVKGLIIYIAIFIDKQTRGARS